MVSRNVPFDDITNEPGAERVLLSIDGRQFELDLAKASRERFDKALAPFLTVARPVGRHPKAKAVGPSSADVRAWAVQAGVAVSAKGKIPDEVLAAYQAAQTS